MTGRRTDAPPLKSEPWICVKCTGVRGAHYLTCPVLRLPAGRDAAKDPEVNR